MSGGISVDERVGTVLFPLSVYDPDENDSFKCNLSDVFYASDASLAHVTQPFLIKESTNEVLLNFQVQSKMTGYFRINITAVDKAGHLSGDVIKVYIITPENRVNFKFDNDESLVQKNRKTVADIFSEVYHLQCNIESITTVTEAAADDPMTSVLSHFVDVDLQQPVLSSVIEGFKLDRKKTEKLLALFDHVNLTLVDIGTFIDPTTDTVEQVFLILFIIACVVIVTLGSALVFFVIRGSRLNRKVAVLSQTKFGSQESGINRMGVSFPNTNAHAVEGSNPVWNAHTTYLSQDQFNQFDNISQSSGDSILIGVEDKEEFRGYQPQTRNTHRKPKAPAPPVVPMEEQEEQDRISQYSTASESSFAEINSSEL